MAAPLRLGRRWSTLPQLADSLWQGKIWASSEGHLFAIAGGWGERHIAEWDGSSWRRHKVPTWPGDLTGIWGRSPREVYVVGQGRVASNVGGRFKNYSAGTWRDMNAIWGSGDRGL